VSTTRLRPISAPFVAAPPSGARVRTRLRTDEHDAAVLRAVGQHLGTLANRDLAERSRQGKLDSVASAISRRERKRALTAQASSRWAGAITRTSEDTWQLAWRNLLAQRRSLQQRVGRIERRLSLPVGAGRGKHRGYATGAEHFAKRQRLQILQARLAEVEGRIAEGQVSVCRGGSRLARTRHHLVKAGLTEAEWRARWGAERLFICADGDAGKILGNLMIRWHPEEHWVELRLPKPLEHLANQPHGRYRLSTPVTFSHRGDEVAAQTVDGAVRYDISFDAEVSRWYLDASWKVPERPVPTVDELRAHPVLSVDLNHGHLAACVLDPGGNPVGAPMTVSLELAGLSASRRDGRLRAAVSELIALAQAAGSRSIVIEDLDFARARQVGRERSGRRPSRGQKGRSFRRMVAGLPTGKFRDRLVQMATNAGLFVITVDPAYTSQWGAEHWLGAVRQISPIASGHHAAAVVIGRRGLGQRARRRGGCDSRRAVHRQKRATDSVAPGGPGPSRKRENQEATGQPPRRPKTRLGKWPTSGDQEAQDRSGPPAAVPTATL
jgi:IS605 OrfB family transposase